MDRNAVAREKLVVLRQTIAGIEGRPAERLVMPETASAHGRRAGDCVYGRVSDGRGPGEGGDKTVAGQAVLLRQGGVAAADIFSSGAACLDAALGGGLPQAALIEIHGRESRDAGAVAGFALALALRSAGDRPRPLIWIGTAEVFAETGFPYAPGLAAAFAADPHNLLFVKARRVGDAAWIADEAARLDSFAAVLLELRGNPKIIGLTATRRLNRRAQTAGRPVFLLRQSGLAEATAAPVRLLVGPAAAQERTTRRGFLAGSIGPPGFSVTISKSRSALEGTFSLVWNRDDRCFEERKDNGAVVSVSGNRPAHPAKTGAVVAFG